MKTKKLIFLVLIALISICNNTYVQAQAKPLDKQAISMLKKFYTAYFEAWSRPPTSDNLKKIKSIQREFCTTSLYNKIIAQYKSQHIGADPFTQSQDINIAWLNTLSFNKNLSELNGYIVSYTEPASKEKIIIHLTVIKQGNLFKISDIK